MKEELILETNKDTNTDTSTDKNVETNIVSEAKREVESKIENPINNSHHTYNAPTLKSNLMGFNKWSKFFGVYNIIVGIIVLLIGIPLLLIFGLGIFYIILGYINIRLGMNLIRSGNMAKLASQTTSPAELKLVSNEGVKELKNYFKTNSILVILTTTFLMVFGLLGMLLAYTNSGIVDNANSITFKDKNNLEIKVLKIDNNPPNSITIPEGQKIAQVDISLKNNSRQDRVLLSKDLYMKLENGDMKVSTGTIDLVSTVNLKSGENKNLTLRYFINSTAKEGAIFYIDNKKLLEGKF